MLLGYVYFVTKTLPNRIIELTRVKVGYFAGNDLENQVHQSYSRSLTPIIIIDFIPSHNLRWAETTVHIALHKWRVNPVNEIFDLSSQEAHDAIGSIKNIILQLSKNTGLPMPMERKINYDYWRIAKQAANAGRQWLRRYNEEQIKQKSDKIKKEKINNKKQEKNNNNKKQERNNNKKQKVIIQNIDRSYDSLLLKYFSNIYIVKNKNFVFNSTDDFVKSFLKFVKDKEGINNLSITNRTFINEINKYVCMKNKILMNDDGFIKIVRNKIGYTYTLFINSLGDFLLKNKIIKNLKE